MASVTLQSVGKTFGNGQAAVRDVTLAIPHGELLVIVGPSGSGKSTVLRLIAGLEQPTSGRVFIGDEDVTTARPEERDVAMVFQSYALYPHLTVRQNLAFGLRMRGASRPVIRERVQRAAATLGLEALLDRKPAQLSGGQRQRVALGRAIVREPRAFLLDEPLSNLDPSLRVDTRAELARLHRRLDATMIHVTHDQEEAMTLGGRIAVMRDGQVEQVGAPLELFERPANVFVAGFLGSPAMNVWRCTVERTTAGEVVACGPMRFPIDAVTAEQLATDGVLAGVRPHDLELADTASADAIGRVDVVEPLGPTTVLHIRLADNQPLRMVVPANRAAAVDAEVGVRVLPGRVHWFDAGTGAAHRHGRS
jgi:multiple sugar transport system ATP-binding protein